MGSAAGEGGNPNQKNGGSQEGRLFPSTRLIILLAARREIALHHPYSAVPAGPWVHVLSVTNAMGIDIDFNINQAPKSQRHLLDLTGNKTHGAVLESENKDEPNYRSSFRRLLGSWFVPIASGVKICLGPQCFFLSLTVDPRRFCAPRLNGIGGVFLALYL